MVEMMSVEIMDYIPFQNELLEYISPFRKEKINCYKYEKDRKRSMLAEFLIQRAVKERLGIESAVLRKTPHGKPYIQNAKGFHFNISHSGAFVIIAVGENNLGIDIEKKENIDFRIVQRFFGEKEREVFSACSEEIDMLNMFYRIWTLKESYTKAIGKGLGIPFSSFDFILDETIEVEDSVRRPAFHFYASSFEDYSLAVCYGDNKVNHVIRIMSEDQIYNEIRDEAAQGCLVRLRDYS